jgi:hypothetical protein
VSRTAGLRIVEAAPADALKGWSLVQVVCRLLQGVKLDGDMVDEILKELNLCLGGRDGKSGAVRE